MEPERLPLLSADELASEEMRKWREEEERKHMEENVMLTAASEKKLTQTPVIEEVPIKKVEPGIESEGNLPTKEVETEVVSPSPEAVAEREKQVAEREKQIAALLESIPITVHEELKTEEEPKVEESKVEEPPEEEIHETMELPLSQDQEGKIAIAMPEAAPVFFRTRVIVSPKDLELSSLQLEKIVYVIGRLGVTTCQSFYDSRHEDPGYDVSWILLELSEESDEYG